MWLGTSGVLFDLQDTWLSMVLYPASDALSFAARYGGNGKVGGGAQLASASKYSS
jgi:hypothetical protein